MFLALLAIVAAIASMPPPARAQRSSRWFVLSVELQDGPTFYYRYRIVR